MWLPMMPQATSAAMPSQKKPPLHMEKKKNTITAASTGPFQFSASQGCACS